jgi:imidazolonepropionase-like amidohydrolase
MPGMIDLHSHVGGAQRLHGFSRDINDMVYQSNPGLRVACTVIPGNVNLDAAVSGGVTTILYIPGSGTAVGGHGVLLKTGFEAYEEMEVRDPGSLKTAQGNNPKSWGTGMGPAFYNWHIRETFRRGVAYAQRWADHVDGEPEPAFDPGLEIFRALVAGEAQNSTHTQQHYVIETTLRIQVREFGIPTYLDHGTFDGFRAAAHAEELGVPAILGPRSISFTSRSRGFDHDGSVRGVAAEYQKRGHTRIGFNTDASVLPQEDLFLQAGMAARYGLVDADLDTVRGLTIVPARAAGIDDRVGSLEPGKDADLVVVTGHPADPRHGVELVYIEGRLVFDADEEQVF